MSKTCKKCGVEKPADDFYTSRRTKDGLRGKCRACTLEECRVYAADPVNVKRKRAMERERHKTRVRDPEQLKRQRLWTWYRMTVEQYESMLEAQGGKCAITACPAVEPGGQGRWHVDHDHQCCPGSRSCGRCVRGLLCSRCNVMLGMGQDDAERLRSAADYLDIHSEVTRAAVH